MRRSAWLAAGLGLGACDIALSLLLYAALLRWPDPGALWAHWWADLRSWDGLAPVVAASLVRGVSLVLAPLAFRAPPPPRVYATALEELDALPGEVLRAAARHSPPVLACVLALASGAVALLRAAAMLAHRPPAPARPLAAALLAGWGALASGLAFALVAGCALAALSPPRPVGRPCRRAAARGGDGDGLTEPLLLSEAEAGEASAASPAAGVPRVHALRRLAQLSAPDALLVATAFGALTLAVVCDVAIPALKADALNAVLAHHARLLLLRASAPPPPGAAAAGAAVAEASASASASAAFSRSFSRSVLWLAAASLGSGLFAGVRGGLLSVANYRLVRRLQRRLFSVLLRLPMASLDASATGRLLSRLTADTALVGDVVGLNLNVAARSLLRLALTTAYLATLSLPLTGVALASSSLFFLVTLIFSRFQARPPGQLFGSFWLPPTHPTPLPPPPHTVQRVASRAAQERTADSTHLAEQARMRDPAHLPPPQLDADSRAGDQPGAHCPRVRRRGARGGALRRGALRPPGGAGARGGRVRRLHARVHHAGQRAGGGAAACGRLAVRAGPRGRAGPHNVRALQLHPLRLHPVRRGQCVDDRARPWILVS